MQARTGRLDVNLFFDIAGKTGQLTNQVCERGTWLRSSIKMVKKRDSGSSGKAVASETRYLQFESCHWRTFICCQLYSCLCVQTVWFLDTFESSHRQNVNCWYLKTRITEKEASSGPIFFLKKNRSKSDFLHSKARVWFHIFSRLTKPTFNLSNRLKIFFESSSSDYSFARAFHLIKIFG